MRQSKLIWKGTLLALFSGGCIDDCGSEVPTVEHAVRVNSPPGTAEVQLTPSNPNTVEDVHVLITTKAADPDGDEPTYRYIWFKNGVRNAEVTGNRLPASKTAKGQLWTVNVIANDGVADGEAAVAETVIINTPPSAEISLAPKSLTFHDLATTAIASDADKDDVSFTYVWRVDGRPTSWTTATVPANATARGERWEIFVTPFDGEDNGPTVTATVEIMCFQDSSVTLTASNIEFVTVCGGSFSMGCTKGQSECDADEAPVMPVTLTRDLLIGRTEVTQGQFETAMGYNPSHFSSCGHNCPVEQVSWHEAAAFTNEVSAVAGLPQCYSCNGFGKAVSCLLVDPANSCTGYRLPTEAEWEGAARCGEDLLYASSSAISEVGWYLNNSGLRTHEVAEKISNACGIFDMSGNVWEWTQDWYGSEYFTSDGRSDPSGPSAGAVYVRRGGSWVRDASSARVANRSISTPNYRFTDIGFRVVRSAP